MKVSDLRRITLLFEDGYKSTDFVSSKDVAKLVKASIALFHNPGINPHTKTATRRRIARIVQSKPVAGRYWWATPDLLKNDDRKGALTIIFLGEEELWVAPSHDC